MGDVTSVDAAVHHVSMEWQPGAAWPCGDVGIDVAGVWAASGAQWLTAEGVPVPARMVAGLVGLVGALDQRGAGLAAVHGASGAGVLASRAALLGLPRSGRVSCGGATRLLRARDGWIAVSLARPDDLRSLPAWLGIEHDATLGDTEAPWSRVAEQVGQRDAAETVEIGGLLGLACSVVAETVHDGDSASPVLLQRRGDATSLPLIGVKVVNLASLWAGPLAADVLRRVGADVVCVESTGRPDGARARPNWFSSLHVDQRSVALDLRADSGVDRLAALLQSADVVIEGSRPRALEQLGIDAADLVERGPRVWVSITGHGRRAPDATRVAFGDDAAAAGGLVGVLDDGPVFIADAVADPLTGLTAAITVVDLLERGGRWLVDVALSRVAACAASRPDDRVVASRADARRPHVAPGHHAPLPLGRDTREVLSDWGVEL